VHTWVRAQAGCRAALAGAEVGPFSACALAARVPQAVAESPGARCGGARGAATISGRGGATWVGHRPSFLGRSNFCAIRCRIVRHATTLRFIPNTPSRDHHRTSRAGSCSAVAGVEPLSSSRLWQGQDTYKMTVHAFVVLSTHAHLLVLRRAPSSLPASCSYLNANIARRSHASTTGPSASGRADTEPSPCRRQAAHARMRYQLSHGAKRVVAAVAPGQAQLHRRPHPRRLLRGTWFTAAPDNCPVPLARTSSPASSPPLRRQADAVPCLLDITEDQRQAHYVASSARSSCRRGCQQGEGPTPMALQAILDKIHIRPEAPDPAPHHWFTPTTTRSASSTPAYRCLRHQLPRWRRQSPSQAKSSRSCS